MQVHGKQCTFKAPQLQLVFQHTNLYCTQLIFIPQNSNGNYSIYRPLPKLTLHCLQQQAVHRVSKQSVLLVSKGWDVRNAILKIGS